MKNGWIEVSLDGITQLIKRGVSPKYVESDGYPIINQKCIRDGFVSLHDARMTSKAKKVTAEKLLQPGDILINSTGTGTLGRTAIVKRVDQETTVDTHVTIVRANDSVDKYFLGYLIRYHEPLITLLGKGSTNQIELSTSDLKIIKLKIPNSKVTQYKIAETLSAYDDLIENNLQRINRLERQVQLIYEEWFVHMRFPNHENTKINKETGLPEGWITKELEDIVDLIKAPIHPNTISMDTPYIGLEHIPRKSICLSTWETAKKVDSLKYQYTQGDILFGKIRPYFHKVGIALNSGITSTDTIVLRSKNHCIKGIALNTVFSKHFVDTATQSSNGTKMPRANWQVLKKYPIIIPTEELLKKYNYIFDSIIRMLEILVKQNKLLEEARDILLPRLMTGIIEL